MPANRESEQKSLTPSDSQRLVDTRSTLASRGLELASLLRQEKWSSPDFVDRLVKSF